MGRALRQASHDVRVADDPALEGWDDPDLFELAASEGEIFITSNACDFVPLVQEWQVAGRNHAGLILLPPSLRHEYFGKIIDRVSVQLADTSHQEWVNRTAWA